MKRSRLLPLCIYIFPAVMDFVLSLILFVCTVRAANEFHASGTETGGLLSVWGLTYMLTCPLLALVITRRNAGTLLLAACFTYIATCGLLAVASSLWSMYALLVLVAVTTALFFAPFQVFMGNVDSASAKPPTYSTGLYTMSWSLGFALGPLVSGYLKEVKPFIVLGQEIQGWQACYLLAIIFLCLTTVGIWMLKHYGDAEPASQMPGQQADMNEAKPAQAQASASIDYSRCPNLAWVAWIAVGLNMLGLQALRGIFPNVAASLHLSDSTQGVINFLINIAQCGTALVLVCSRTWMYRFGPTLAFSLCGAAGLACFGLGSDATTFMAGAAMYGVFCGSFFFYFVFHAIAHPDKAPRQVAINETVVGVASIAGPLLAGGMADYFLARFHGEMADHLLIQAAFLAFLPVMAGVLVFQWFAHRRNPMQPDTCQRQN